MLLGLSSWPLLFLYWRYLISDWGTQDLQPHGSTLDPLCSSVLGADLLRETGSSGLLQEAQEQQGQGREQELLKQLKGQHQSEREGWEWAAGHPRAAALPRH